MTLLRFAFLSTLLFLVDGFHTRCSPWCGKYYDFEHVLAFAGDGVYDQTPVPAFFKQQFANAGIDEAGIIQEGKRAAQYYKDTYGVDVAAAITNDNVYLAPNVALGNGITFTYATVSRSLNFNLVMASRRNYARFFNTPVDAVWYTLRFSQDYVSTGSFTGTIPANHEVVIGNYFIDTPRNYVLGKKVFIRYTCDYTTATYQPGPFLAFNCTISHREWGIGALKGLFVFNQETGMMGGRETLTFPCCNSHYKSHY